MCFYNLDGKLFNIELFVWTGARSLFIPRFGDYDFLNDFLAVDGWFEDTGLLALFNLDFGNGVRRLAVCFFWDDNKADCGL